MAAAVVGKALRAELVATVEEEEQEAAAEGGSEAFSSNEVKVQ